MKKLATFALLSILIGCDQTTVRSSDTLENSYPQGRSITVNIDTERTTSTGKYTRMDYGTTYQHNYTVFIKPDDITWKSPNSKEVEPENILFCENDTYIQYSIKHAILVQVEVPVTTDNQPNPDESKELNIVEDSSTPTTKIIERYESVVESRYQKSIGGNWVIIDEDEYKLKKKSGCQEYTIPNKSLLDP